MKTESLNAGVAMAPIDSTLMLRLKEAAETVGTVPPVPPTLRGFVGRLGIGFMIRVMSWYSSQIRSFQQLSSQAHASQFELLEKLYEIVVHSGDRQGVQSQSVAKGCMAPGAGILDQMATTYPSDQNALNIFRNEWWSKMPSSRSDLPAGLIPLFEDSRVQWALCEAGGVENQRVLELGPLEGGHTYMLQALGAASIVAIESNTRAFLKCLIVKNIFKLDKADFRCGDFVFFLKQNTERFDFVLASGILYHMANPVETLELLSKVTDRMYIWTHYYDEAIVPRLPGVSSRMIQSWKASHEGFAHTLHRYEYGDALQLSFMGGNRPFSCWMEREEILSCLRYFGFHNLRIAFEQPDHPNGPAFAILVQRT